MNIIKILSDNIGTLITGLIAIITLIINYLQSSRHDINETKRQERILSNNILLDNRKYIPGAAKEILLALNELYKQTQNLCINYPFVENIYEDKHSANYIRDIKNKYGFLESISEKNKLISNWEKSRTCYMKYTSINSMYINNEDSKRLRTFEKKCKEIKVIFCGYYSFENQEEYTDKKTRIIKEFNKNINNHNYKNNDFKTSIDMKKLYEKLSILKKQINTRITNYVSESIGIEKDTQN